MARGRPAHAKKTEKQGRIYLKTAHVSGLGRYIKTMFGHTIASKTDWLTEEK